MDSTQLLTARHGIPSLLDQVRGVVASGCNSGTRFLQPISSLAVRNALIRRCVAADAPDLLHTLQSLRDLQNLPFGHWLPIPSHGVAVDQCILLVSGYPTEVLRRDLGLVVTGNGLGRLSERSNPSIPMRTIERWLGAPRCSDEWSNAIVEDARFGDPLGWERLELFDHWSNQSGRRWSAISTVGISNGIALGRSVTANTGRSYHLLSVSNRAVTGMFDLPRGVDIRRLTISFLARGGHPYGFKFLNSGTETTEIRAPFLPQDETRLLKALGPVREMERGLQAEIPSSAASQVRGVLLALGLIERR